MSSSPASSSGGEGVPVTAAAAAVLAFPWCVHAGLVGASACGLPLLASRAAAVVLVVGSLAASAGVFVWARGQGGEPAGARGVEPLERLSAGLVAVGAAVFLWSLAAAVAFPVVAYDAIGYRLPAIAQWLDRGRVAWLHTDDAVRNGYPLGQEAVTAVLAAATGSLRFAAAASFPQVAAGALALTSLAHGCGARPLHARAAGALFVLAPMVPLNAASGYVDAAYAGAVVALIAFAARIEPARAPGVSSPVALVGAGLAAAHVLSLKGNGVVFASLVFAAVLLRAVAARAWPRGLWVAVLLAAPGAFWVLRNVSRTGNPFWPVRMEAAGRVVFPGTASLEQVLDTLHNTPPELASLRPPLRVLRAWLELSGPATDFDARLAGMGLAWVLVALPAAVYCLVAPGVVSEPVARARVRFVAASTGLCFLVQPMSWWARYTLWLWGLGGLCVALAVTALSGRGSGRAATGLLALGAALAVPEGVLAALHANGAHAALAAGGPSAFLGPSDPRRPPNVRRWVDPAFWALGLERDSIVCRGFWKPGTDDANLDGVFAQLVPRPRVVAISDETATWSEVRRAYEAAGCRRLLLFSGSPLIAPARRDPGVSVTEVLAFDPLFLVTSRDPRADAPSLPSRP